MPTYQYQCTECGESLEVQQSFTEDALTECPTCHGRLRKVFNAVGVVFKGSGFYRNDSRVGSGSTSGSGATSTSTPTSSGTSSSGKDSTGASSSSSSSSSGSGSGGSGSAA